MCQHDDVLLPAEGNGCAGIHAFAIAAIALKIALPTPSGKPPVLRRVLAWNVPHPGAAF